jgi:predicted metal-dependent hydrolase
MSREIVLGGLPVAYEFKRSRRRTIGMTVGAQGLAVSAPRWVPLYEVEAALREKAAWIVKKLDEMKARQAQQQALRVVWQPGVILPVLGSPKALELRLPPDATPAQVRNAAQAWFKRQARPLFVERLNHYAPLLGVQWNRLALSSARTRWGSASSKGAINLNWRLMHFRLEVIDYVVAHELSHLRVMDHSPRFWATVASVMPDYERLRQTLRDEVLPLWD